jgi:hypothetical protein
MLAHAWNPSYSGGRSRKTVVWAQPWQKWETLSEKQTKKQKDWGRGWWLKWWLKW